MRHDVVGVRAVEQHDLAVLDDRGRVVDVRGLPAVALRRQDRVLVVGLEGPERELRVGVGVSGHVSSFCSWKAGSPGVAGSASDQGETSGGNGHAHRAGGARRDADGRPQSVVRLTRAGRCRRRAPGRARTWSRRCAAVPSRGRRRPAPGVTPAVPASPRPARPGLRRRSRWWRTARSAPAGRVTGSVTGSSAPGAGESPCAPMSPEATRPRRFCVRAERGDRTAPVAQVEDGEHQRTRVVRQGQRGGAAASRARRSRRR